jgi:hypothetical protein
MTLGTQQQEFAAGQPLQDQQLPKASQLTKLRRRLKLDEALPLLSEDKLPAALRDPPNRYLCHGLPHQF